MNADDEFELFGKPNDTDDTIDNENDVIETSAEEIEDAEETEIESETDSKSDIATNTSPIKAIRLKCLDCCCWQYSEVKACTCTDCPLYPFRFGKNPFIKRTYTYEEKQKIKERLQTGRNKKKNT